MGREVYGAMIDRKSLLLVGHRGASAYYPENTLISFKKAFEIGANAVECDVRRSKDGKIVVIHDDSINRTTNGKGKVGEFSLLELKKFDAGNGEKIPLLADVVKFINGRKILVVEIKEKGIEKDILKIVEKRKKNVIIVSFNLNVLKKIREIDGEIETGLIFSNKIRDLIGFFRLGKAIKTGWLGDMMLLIGSLLMRLTNGNLRFWFGLLTTKKELGSI